MNKFIILKNIGSNKDIILDEFKNFVGSNIEAKIEEEYLIIYYLDKEYIDVKSFFLSLGTELLINLIGYMSSDNPIGIDKEYKIAKILMSGLSEGMYNLKEALLHSSDLSRSKKSEILKLILDRSGIDELFVKGFISVDLNVSKASQVLYIHRNTLNYKLDKLKELSGFDLRGFMDAFLITKLIY